MNANSRLHALVEISGVFTLILGHSFVDTINRFVLSHCGALTRHVEAECI